MIPIYNDILNIKKIIARYSYQCENIIFYLIINIIVQYLFLFYFYFII